MVSVPVEPLKAALDQEKRGADKAGCDGWRAQEMCRQIVQLLEPLTAAPVREEGRAWTPDDMRELVSDEQVRHLVSATDVAQGRSRLCDILNALATREEAPAEAGEDTLDAWREFEGDHLTDGKGNATAETYRLCRAAFDAGAALRAQPQAREEAQPVAWRWRYEEDGVTPWYFGAARPTTTTGIADPTNVEPLYTTPPAPEAEKLRSALTRIAAIENGWNRPHRPATARQMVEDCVSIALAALQQEGK